MKNHKTHLIAVGFCVVGKSLQKGQRHEFNPSVVAMADRMLITVWIMIFQVSLFFIIIKGLQTPSAPFGASDLRRAEDCAPLATTQIDIQSIL